MAPTSSAMPSPLLEFLSGSLFGSALLLSGVYSPAVIQSQLNLTNFHMLEAFLSASAVSAVVVSLADKTGWSATQIRDPRNLKLLSGIPYSGNLVGGTLLGIGMGLTGACPGTVLVQIASGVRSGIWVAAGGLVGGIVWSLSKASILNTPMESSAAKGAQKSTANIQVRPGSTAHTIQSQLNLTTDTVFLLYELICLSMIVASLYLAPKVAGASFVPPAVGGLFIGLAQAATLLMTRKTVGVSGAYADIGRWITRQNLASLVTPSVVFAGGILAGSTALASQPGVMVSQSVESPSPLLAAIGGILSIFGASMAGGCTSGHGISGMATLSSASFITVAAMFGSGIATVKSLSQ